MTRPRESLKTSQDKVCAAISVALIGGLFIFFALAAFGLIYDAWHYDDAPTEAQIRWDLLDNEWDRNMHDPTQRPPDSIADEARLKMLLLEDKK